MKRLLISGVLLMLCVGSYGQKAKKKPLHSWDVFMRMPEAVAEAKKYKGRCGDADVQAVMNACYAQEADETQENLDKIYHKTLAKLPVREKTKLRQAQLAWTKRRNLRCQAAANQEGGGSMEPMIISSCLADSNRDRITELQKTHPAHP